MTIEYYFECSECGRWYMDESSESNTLGVCIHCAVHIEDTALSEPF